MVAELEYKEVDGLLYPVLRSGRDGELGETGKIRTSGDEVSGGERTGEIQDLLRTGRMTEKMLEVEEEANRMMEQLQKQYRRTNYRIQAVRWKCGS